MKRFYLLSTLKGLVVKGGSAPRRVPFGVFRGQTLEIDFRNQLQVYLGFWERETHPFLMRVSRSCQWAVDVGAGMGELCVFLLCSQRVEKVYAFEPNPKAMLLFNRNLELNGFQNDARVSVSGRFVGTRTDPEFRTVDSLELDKSKQGFIKIDVEGAELDVLKSADMALRSGQVTLLIETHSLVLEDECVRFLQERNYHCTIIKNAWWKRIIPEHRPIAHNRWIWAERQPC